MHEHRQVLTFQKLTVLWDEDDLLSRKSKYGVIRTVCDGGNTECYGGHLGTSWWGSDPRLRFSKEEVEAV